MARRLLWVRKGLCATESTLDVLFIHEDMGAVHDTLVRIVGSVLHSICFQIPLVELDGSKCNPSLCADGALLAEVPEEEEETQTLVGLCPKVQDTP